MKFYRSGFTLIELMIVMIVMVILLGLGVVSLGNIQAQARDKEREEDIASIARGLENRYNQGNPIVTAPDYVQKGSYPGVNETLHIDGWDRSDYVPVQYDGNYRGDAFPGTSDKNFINPNSQWAWYIVCVWACQPAGDATQLQTAFANNDGDKYVYEPYDANGNICSNGPCLGYNLYWKSETDTTVVKGIAGLKMVRSKHR